MVTGWKLLVAFAAVYTVWGSTYFAIRVAVDSLPPFWLASARFLSAGWVLYLWARWRGAPKPRWEHWRSTFIVGTFLLMGGNGLVVWSEQRVSSGLAAVLVSTVPLWMVTLEQVGLFAPPGARGRRRKSVWLGPIIGFIGIVLLISPGKTLGSHPDPLGSLALLVASSLWAIGSLYARRAPMPASMPMTTGMEMLGGGLVLLIVGALAGEWNRFHPAQVTAASWWALAYLAAFGSIIGFSAYLYLLRHTTVARASTYAYVNPVIALLLGRVFLGETLSTRSVVATTIILSAVALMLAQKPEEHSEPA